MTSPDVPTIVFQGRRLPAYASVIDVAGACLDGVEEETALWFWRFTICVGVTRSAPSADVARHVAKLREALRRHRDELPRALSRRLPDADPDRVLNEWDQALDAMSCAAAASDGCAWYAQAPVPDE